MKKYISILCVAAILAIGFCAVPAFAAGSVSFSMASDTSPARPGDTIIIKVNISGVKSTSGIAAIGPATLKYDTTKLTFVSAGNGSVVKASDTMSNQSGSEVYLEYNDSAGGKNPLKKDGTVFQVKFKVKSTVAPGTTSFSLSVASVGDTGGNSISIKQNGLTLMLAKPLSDNADLTALIVSNAVISPKFSSSTTKYTASVPFDISKLQMTPTTKDAKASVKVTNNDLKAGGETTVAIKVTAENGKTKTYTIAVTRAEDPNAPTTTEPLASQDTDLQSITVDGFLLSPPFAKGKAEYVVWVPFETKQVKVSAKAADKDAKVTVTGGQNLVVGKNTVTVSCKAPDGSEKVYTVVVRRAPIHGMEDITQGTTQPATNTLTTTTPAPEENNSGVKAWVVIVIALVGLAAGGVGGVFLVPMLTKDKRF